MRRVIAGLLAFGLGACAPAPIEIALPSLAEDTRAVIVAIEREGTGAPEIAHIVALPHPAAASLSFDLAVPDLADHERALVVVLEYDRPLDHLGLASGPLSRARDGEIGELIPATERRRAAAIERGRTGAFEELDALPEALAGYRLPPRPLAGCPELESELLTLDTVGFLQLAIPLEDGSALVGTRDPDATPPPRNRDLFRVHRDRRVLRRATPPAMSNARAAAEGAGRLFVSDESGKLFELVLDEPARDQTWTSTAPGVPIFMTSTRERASPFELFGLTTQGHLMSFDFDRRQWRTHHRIDGLPMRGDGLGGLSLVAPGEVFAAKGNSTEVAHLKDGVVTTSVPFEGTSDTGLTAIAAVPGMGVVVANGRAEFAVLEGERWVPFGGPEFGLKVNVIIPYPGGFLWGGSNGVAGAYLREPGRFCPIKTLAPYVIYAIIPFGDDVLLASNKPDDAEKLTIAIARRKR